MSRSFRRIESALRTLPVTTPTSFAQADGAACPDFFDIGAPVGIDLRALSADSPVDRFVISLSLAFNDLRDCGWVMQQLDKGEPKDFEIGSYMGVWLGMRLWISRQALGAASEVLKALQAHATLLATSPELADTHAAMSEFGRKEWSYLLRLSKGEAGTDAEQRFLLRVRNNLASHYYQPDQLGKGFQRAFVERRQNNPGRHNDALWVSAGDAVKHTRFYFADAAAQCAQELLREEIKPTTEELGRIMTGIAAFVRAFLDRRHRIVTKTPRRSRPAR